MIKIFALGFLITMNIQILQAQSPNQTIRQSIWKGFERKDFKLQQHDVRFILPKKALLGNPWLWRARFPDYHATADSILVAEGFHLVYVDTNNGYGSPGALKIWDSAYQYFTEKYQLNEKVALAGVSRGGLFVYNWAKKNPEKVACIYAEAPVCDFKSWPMGDSGQRSEEDWERLKEAYGFESDEEAVAYADNPIDNLGPLAKLKIPVLHMISLQDKIVPPGDNTYVLINRYIKLGGIATVVPCTESEQRLEGHHFDIETPEYVADFIKYYAVQNIPLDASEYHTHGGGLQNSKLKFERDRRGRIAFLGGSITYNGGWRDSLMNYFQRRFLNTNFDFIAAGIPSMGTTPSAYRLKRDVLYRGKVDLLFVEAAVNDSSNGRTSKEQLRAMEGIIRHLRNANPAIDIVMMHFVDPDKMKDYRSGREPEVIKNHNKVAGHYNIPTINLAKEVTERIDHGEFTWENDFKNLHPSPFGQGVYAHSMVRFLERAYSGHADKDDKIAAHPLPEKLDEGCYDNGTLIDVSGVKPSKGWSIDPSWKPTDGTGSRANYRNVPMLIGEKPGNSIKTKFSGNAVGIAVAAGKDAGIIEYRIDNGEWQKQNLFTRWSKHLHLPWYYTLAAGLSSDKHQLEIRLIEEQDKNSEGTACRIRYFFVNQ